MAKVSERFAKRSIGSRLFNLAWFQYSGIDVFGLASMNVKYRMMRVDPLTAMLSVASKKLKAAG